MNQEITGKKAIIEEAKSNTAIREEVLRSYKPLLLRYASRICRRQLNWDNDEELSIAFSVLDKAIDSYKPEGKASFDTYLYALLKNRLIDYFRQQGKEKAAPLKDTGEEASSPLEVKASLEAFKEQVEVAARAEEIHRYEKLLKAFGISFDVLENDCPRHRDTRNNLQQAALTLVSHEPLVKYLLKEKKLPIKGLLSRFSASRKVLERGRRYIIAVALIMLFPDEFPCLRDYVPIQEDKKKTVSKTDKSKGKKASGKQEGGELFDRLC